MQCVTDHCSSIDHSTDARPARSVAQDYTTNSRRGNCLRPPRSVPAGLLKNRVGNKHILGDLEIEHPGQYEIGAVVEYITERIFRRYRPGGHHLKRDPGLFHRLHHVDRFLGILAPVARYLGMRALQLAGLRPGRVLVVVERLDIEIRIDILSLTGEATSPAFFAGYTVEPSTTIITTSIERAAEIDE